MNNSLIYFLTRSLFLGFGLSLLFNNTGKDTYLAILLGILLGLIITYFYKYIISHKNTSLKELYKKQKYIGFIAQSLLILSSIIILLYTLILYCTFTISFLLNNSPDIYILIPFLLLACYGAFKSLNIISRISIILLPLSIILSILPFLGLIGYIEVTNFLPILSTTPLNFFKTAIFFAGISSFPNILTLHLKNTKNYFKIYLLACFMLLLSIISTTGVFGEHLISIFRFPEYMVLKQVKIFNFIEKVENIFSTVWLVDIYITATMAIYSLKKSLPFKHNKLITSIIVIIIALITDQIFSFNYKMELYMYYILPFVSLILSIIIIFPFMYLIKKSKT